MHSQQEDLERLSARRKRFQLFFQYTRRYLRTAEQELTIPLSSIHDILQNRLLTFPYKLHVVQHFEDGDYEARIEFVEWCLQNIHGYV